MIFYIKIFRCVGSTRATLRTILSAFHERDDRSTIGMRPIGSRDYESRNPIAVGSHGDKPAAVKDL